MPYRVTLSDPYIMLDPEKAERRIAVFLKSKGVTTDAELDTVIDAMDATQLAAATRALLKAIVRVL